MADLIERLRMGLECEMSGIESQRNPDGCEAADTIQSLRAALAKSEEARETAERMLAAVRRDAMTADNDLCSMEARAEAAEASLSQALARIEELEKVIEWYGEQARLCRLVHSEGDSGRHALAGDGGKRARSILPATPIDGGKG